MRTGLYFLVAGLLICVSCGPQGWSAAEQAAVSQSIKPFPEVDFRAMTLAERQQFKECVLGRLMRTYPSYTLFSRLKNRADTLYSYAVLCGAEYVGNNYIDLRTVFPYEELVRQGILPASIDSKQLDSFYICLSGKIRSDYMQALDFLRSVQGDSTARAHMSDLIKTCALRLPEAGSFAE